MKENRALISYTAILEGKTDKLREKLGILDIICDSGVSWRFLPCIFTLEDKELLQSLITYIRKECIEPHKEIEDRINFLRKEGKEALLDSHEPEETIRLAEEEMENGVLTWDEYLDECESDYNFLLDDYEELIELIEYLMK